MKKMELLKKIILPIIMLTLLISITGCSQKTVPTVTKISTQIVKIGDLQIGLYADGRISIPLTNVNFNVSGTVNSILVQPGQSVQSGDLLAVLENVDLQQAILGAQRDVDKSQSIYDDAILTHDYILQSEKIKLDSFYAKYNIKFDTTAYDEDISDAQTKVAEKQLNLETAKTTYNQLFSEDKAPEILSNAEKTIAIAEAALLSAQETQAKTEVVLRNALIKFSADKIVAKENYDIQKLKYNNLINSSVAISNAKYNLEISQEKLNNAKNDLEKINLYAPITGKVINISYNEGDQILSRSTTDINNSTTAATSFITLYNPSEVYLNAFINEGDISDLEIGQITRVSVDALGLENLTGQVTEINVIPKIDNTGIVAYAVKSKLDKPNEQILDGMNTFIMFLKKEKTNVLLVPNKAVFMEEGKQYVMVQLEDGTPTKREIICGLSNGTQSEVIEGLFEGDIVIIGGVKI